jgi:hypothetical protein
VVKAQSVGIRETFVCGKCTNAVASVPERHAGIATEYKKTLFCQTPRLIPNMAADAPLVRKK